MTYSSPERVLGFDFGLKKIGVAVGQLITQTARPLTLVKAQHGIPDWTVITKLISDWQPDALVVGLPLNMDGTPQPITHAAQQFAEILKKRFALPVYTWDERLSSVDARERIFAVGGYKALQNTHIDCIAAQLILEDWLHQQ